MFSGGFIYPMQQCVFPANQSAKSRIWIWFWILPEVLVRAGCRVKKLPFTFKAKDEQWDLPCRPRFGNLSLTRRIPWNFICIGLRRGQSNTPSVALYFIGDAPVKPHLNNGWAVKVTHRYKSWVRHLPNILNCESRVIVNKLYAGLYSYWGDESNFWVAVWVLEGYHRENLPPFSQIVPISNLYLWKSV